MQSWPQTSCISVDVVAGEYLREASPAPGVGIQRDAMAMRANPGSGISDSSKASDVAKIAGGGGAALFIALVALVAVVVTMNRKKGKWNGGVVEALDHGGVVKELDPRSEGLSFNFRWSCKHCN